MKAAEAVAVLRNLRLGGGSSADMDKDYLTLKRARFDEPTIRRVGR